MPGLVGIVSLDDKRVNISLFKKMQNYLYHRNYYSDNFHDINSRIAISRIHLGKIDKEKQPRSFSNGIVKIFLNGEIYNEEGFHPKALESIYDKYIKYDMEFPLHLNGSFQIVIIDEKRKATFIVNDKIASKPLFYYVDRNFIYFSPELKSLLLIPSIKRNINLDAIADFLSNGFFTKNHTYIKHLNKMENATIFKIKENELSEIKYWEYNPGDHEKYETQNYFESKLNKLLRKAVRRRIKAEGKYGILLSGGYDSKGILGCFLEENTNSKFMNITWGEKENIPGSDCLIAKTISKKIGADHLFLELSAEEVFNNIYEFVWLSEGLTAWLKSYKVFFKIKDEYEIDYILRGDEIFGRRSIMTYDEHTMFRNIHLQTLENIQIYKKLLKPKYFKIFSETDRKTKKYISSRCSAKNIHDRACFFYLNIRLKNYINHLNYARSIVIESLNPWLDNEIIELICKMPIKYRVNKNLYKETIKKMFPDLFKENNKFRNDIDWNYFYKNSKEAQEFIFEKLIKNDSIITQFFEIEKLKNELKKFFNKSNNKSSSNGSIKILKKYIGINLRMISPYIFNLLYKYNYFLSRKFGRVYDDFPFYLLINRLLVLTIFEELFLKKTYPKKVPYFNHY